MVEEMSEAEAKAFIVALMSKRGSMTTREIEAETKQVDRRCPDGAVKFLMRLRSEGIVEGNISLEAGGWVWRLRPGIIEGRNGH